MECSWPENLPSDRRKAINELVRGREIASQLKLVINKAVGDDGLVVGDLVTEILNSFANSLAILNRIDEPDEVSQFREAGHVGSPCWDGRKSEDSGDSSKSTSTLKDRRGCYKRRKTSHSWIRESPNLTDDGHAWRKYGQKVILNAKYPRNYFRCTHKFDQGCQATKQVQRIEEEPVKYRTTYYGHHTCKNLLKPSQLIIEPNDIDSSFILSFSNNTTTTTNKKETSLFTSLSSIKQEHHKLDMPSGHNLTHTNNSSNNSHQSSDDYFLSAIDQGDVISGVNSSCTTTTSTATHHSFEDINMMVESVDFVEDVLGYF